MRALTPRETALLIGSLMVIGLVGLLQFVILPANVSRQGSLAQLTKFETVSSVIDRLPTAKAGMAPSPMSPLRQRVAEQAKQAGLEIRRLDPQGAKALSVSFDDVPFAALIGWVDQLTAKSRVQVLSAEIGRRPEPGFVSARFVLEGQ